MKQLARCAVSIGFLVFCAAMSAQTTTTGNRDASITSGSTRTNQQRPQPTPTPVTPVRPLSQEDRQRQEASSARRRQEAATGDPDVLLDIPNLSVDEITLTWLS